MFIPSIAYFIKIGDDYSTTSGRIIHQSCEEECPGLCTNDWIFYDEITLIIENSNATKNQKKLDVSCGKINQIIFLGKGGFRL